jgi:hypothetical protein
MTSLLLAVLADNTSEGMVFTTITSGTVVQTMVLQTQIITDCPCNGTRITATGMAVATIPILAESSRGNMDRPGTILGVVGCLVALGGMAIIS